MNVCHLTSVHSRYDGRIFRKECNSLVKAGYNVSLIVADGKGNEVKNNINIIDVGASTGRISRFILSIFKIKRYALKLNCEVYHFHDPELIFLGLYLKRMNKKVIFDMHENIPLDISEKAYINPIIRKVISYLYVKLEIYAVKKFDIIISTRESINNRLIKYNKNIHLITNYPIIEDEIKKNDGELTSISFAGAVSNNWQHEKIIKAIEQIDGIKYNLAGPVNLKYLERLKKLNGWSKVNYLGKIPFESVNELYKNETIGVAIYVYCKNMDDKKGNFANTKLFEYMNWEIPIICSDFSLWKEVIENELKCGICVNPYDTNEIINAINYLIKNPEISKQMGKNGKKGVLNKYNWNSQELILINIYNSLFQTY